MPSWEKLRELGARIAEKRLRDRKKIARLIEQSLNLSTWR